jgi:hypothetical protein
MKKLLLASALLLVGTVFLFAVDIEPKVEISGSATLTWGISLADTVTGFLNETSSNMIVTIVPKQSSAKGSADDGFPYGYINITDFRLIFNATDNDSDETAPVTDDDGTVQKMLVYTAPGVTAKVYFSPNLSWVIAGAPDLLVNFVGDALEGDSDGYTAEDDETADALDVMPDYGTYGTGITFSNDMITVSGNVVTPADWTANTGNAYGVGLDADVTLSPLTVSIGALLPFPAGSTYGFGGKLALDMAPVTAWVGFDGALTGTDLIFDLGANVTLTLEDLLTFSESVVWGEYQDLDSETSIDLTAVENLELGADLGLYDIDTVLRWVVWGNLGYKIMLDDANYVKPYAKGNYDSAARVGLEVGAEAMFFPRTVFTLKWLARDLTNDIGDITFATKVTY